MTPTAPPDVSSTVAGSTPDVEVRAHDRERQPRKRLEECVHAVVELVVADRGRRDRQVGDLAPGALAEKGICRTADDEVTEVQPDRGLPFELALEQIDDARAGSPLP